MRQPWLATALLLFSAISSAAAGPRSNAAAVSLVAHVAPVLRLQAESPTATSATATVTSTSQNAFTLEFTVAQGEAALIHIPVVMRVNVDDVLFRAAFNGASGGLIWMEESQTLGTALLSRPMPVGTQVTFAMASGLFSASAVGAPLPGTIAMAIPAGAVPEGKRVAVQITMEALRQ